MLVRFKDKIYEIPAPVPSKLFRVIQVVRYLQFELPPDPTEDVFTFSHRLPKLCFFLVHEGPRLTWRKVATSLLQKQIIREKALVLAYGRLEGTDQYAIGVGPQSCAEAECLVFPEQCTISAQKERLIQDDFHRLAVFFQQNPQQFYDLYNYSPFSGKELKFHLGNALTSPAVGSSLPGAPTPRSPVLRATKQKKINKLGIAEGAQQLFLAGAGVYSCSYILPSLKKVSRHTVIDLNPLLACIVKENHNFMFAATSCEEAFRALPQVKDPVLIIETYHSTHVPIAQAALSLNPSTRVMIEKPPATTLSQLIRLIELRLQGHAIEIGYNRRYSPLVIEAERRLSQHGGPITMTCIVREKSRLPLTHWYYWPSQGTRVNGNLCHWIDLGVHFIQRLPVSFTTLAPSQGYVADDPVISVLFEDGSILNIVATDRGNSLRGIQELIDIKRGDLSIQIDDFLKMTVKEAGHNKTIRRIIRDKGHGRMYSKFIDSSRANRPPSYPNYDLFVSSFLCFTIADALLSKNRYVEIDLTDHLKRLGISRAAVEKRLAE